MKKLLFGVFLMALSGTQAGAIVFEPDSEHPQNYAVEIKAPNKREIVFKQIFRVEGVPERVILYQKLPIGGTVEVYIPGRYGAKASICFPPTVITEQLKNTIDQKSIALDKCGMPESSVPGGVLKEGAQKSRL